MKTKYITEPVFSTYVTLLYDCSLKEANQYLFKKYQLRFEDDKDTYGRLYLIDDTEPYIWIESRHIGHIIHEVAHLLFYWFEEKNIPVSRENEEIFAYFQTYYATEINIAMYKKRKRKGVKK